MLISAAAVSSPPAHRTPTVSSSKMMGTADHVSFVIGCLSWKACPPEPDLV